MQLNIAYDFLPRAPSVRASMVMDHFGIDAEPGRHVIAEDLELTIQPGDVVLFTGASGSGKSSLLRAVADRYLVSQSVLNIDELDLGEQAIIDSLKLPVCEAMNLLSSCGLGEAQLLLRSPGELSEGQRYRYRLALGLSQSPDWLVADEFTATLDRTLAKVIAFNIRRLATRSGTGFLLATTHEDIIDDLRPDLHVQCRLDGCIVVTRSDSTTKPSQQGAKPSAASPASVSQTTSTSRPAPVRTGRISRGGIIDHTTSDSSNR